MALENMRVVDTEVVAPNDRRFVDCDDIHLERNHNGWYVKGTNEPVTFADRDEEIAWIQNNLRVGDQIDVDRGWSANGKITHLNETNVRIENRDGSVWNLDRDYVVSRLRSWRIGRVAGHPNR